MCISSSQKNCIYGQRLVATSSDFRVFSHRGKLCKLLTWRHIVRLLTAHISFVKIECWTNKCNKTVIHWYMGSFQLKFYNLWQSSSREHNWRNFQNMCTFVLHINLRHESPIVCQTFLLIISHIYLLKQFLIFLCKDMYYIFR